MYLPMFTLLLQVLPHTKNKSRIIQFLLAEREEMINVTKTLKQRRKQSMKYKQRIRNQE